LRHPPLLEELSTSPRLEHEACRRVECARDDDLALGRPFHGEVFHRRGLTFSSCVHRASPFVSIPRPPGPTRRNARPRVGGISRSMPPLSRVGTGPACRCARALPSPW